MSRMPFVPFLQSISSLLHRLTHTTAVVEIPLMYLRDKRVKVSACYIENNEIRVHLELEPQQQSVPTELK